ncbi:hypothetical protein J6590_038516 [Homalodisca vitripennis]|nr:hypothetical protein J6590_038516 [Homalodisca vitripennis]
MEALAMGQAFCQAWRSSSWTDVIVIVLPTTVKRDFLGRSHPGGRSGNAHSDINPAEKFQEVGRWPQDYKNESKKRCKYQVPYSLDRTSTFLPVVPTPAAAGAGDALVSNFTK